MLHEETHWFVPVFVLSLGFPGYFYGFQFLGVCGFEVEIDGHFVCG